MARLTLRTQSAFIVLLLFAANVTAQAPDTYNSAALLEEAWRQVRATEFEEAFNLLDQALAVSRASGDQRQEIDARLAMGFALVESGAYQRSINWIEDTLPMVEELRGDTEEATAEEARLRCQLAKAYQVMVQRDRAREEIAIAEMIFRRLGDNHGLATVAARRALLDVSDQRYEEAVQSGNEALALLRDPDNDAQETELALQALSAVAYGQHQRDQLDEALAGYERILDLAWKVNDQRQLNFAYCNRAEVRWHLGGDRPVEEDLRRAIAGLEDARSRIPGTADQRAEYMVRQVAAYDRLIRYLAETSRGREAFEVAERFHARSFLEMLDRPTLRAQGSQWPTQWRRRQELLDEIGRIRLQEDPSLTDQAESNDDARRLSRLESELEDIESQLTRHQDMLTAEPPTLADIQAGLNPEEALIAYWLTDERVLVWAVRQESIDFVQIPIPRTEIERQVQDYLGLLRSPRRAEDAALQNRESDHLAVGQKLHDWLIAALPKSVQAAERWTLVPDGVLHYLPFEALVAGCDTAVGVANNPHAPIHAPYRSCRFLGLEKALAYSSSAGALMSLRRRAMERQGAERPDDARSTLLALAPKLGDGSNDIAAELRNEMAGRAPLLHARDEVQRIADHFNAANVRLDELATEEHLKREAGQYRLLHMATHGLVSDDYPMSSGVLLVPGQGDDGLLQAHEVMGLELNADVVTLSACRTGRGMLRRGEGVIGLSRSFLAAGASSVVVSLWDVDDRSTPLLMETFYREIAAGLDPPAAMLTARQALFEQLGEARLVFKTKPLAYAHPRFWASFVVVGD